MRTSVTALALLMVGSPRGSGSNSQSLGAYLLDRLEGLGLGADFRPDELFPKPFAQRLADRPQGVILMRVLQAFVARKS